MAKQEHGTPSAPRLWPSSTQSGEGGGWSRGEQREMESDRELRKSVTRGMAVSRSETIHMQNNPERYWHIM